MNPDRRTHEEIRTLLGVYALDAIDRDERNAVDAHLADCDECRTEVDEHRNVAALLAQSEDSVPDELWDRVQAKITGEEAGGVVPLQRRPRAGLPTMAVAAAFLLLVGITAVQTIRLDDASERLAAAESELIAVEQALASGDLGTAAVLIAESDGADVVRLDGDGMETSIAILPDGTAALVGADLPSLGGDHTYQLWAVQGEEVVSAAVLGADPSSSIFRVDPATLEALVITEERAGGVAVSEQPALAAWFAP